MSGSYRQFFALQKEPFISEQRVVSGLQFCNLP
jgi:hypothetical protein